MKHIAKHCSIAIMDEWRRNEEQAEPANVHYGCLQQPEKRALHECLLREQGGLCAYTGIRVAQETSHIEHLRPQSECKTPGLRPETVKGENMVACFPGARSEKTPCRFGALARRNWNGDPGTGARFVAPTEANVAEHFRYRLDGTARCSEEAERTGEALRLNHEELVQLRLHAIRGFVEALKAQPEKAKSVLAGISARDREGRFMEFCFVIESALRPSDG